MVASKRADFDAIAAKFNIDKVIARIIRNRDIITDREIDLFLNGTLDDLHSPHLMKDMDKAASIIKDAIEKGSRIRIMSDFDVDGICAAYILQKGLEVLGANVDTDIPDRIRDGYGLNDQMVEKAADDGVNLIITCDNGIAASSQTELARKLGMDVIVTDHHEVPYDIINGDKVYNVPDACAVVDPKQEDCPYPFKSICGAVVAYKLFIVLAGEEHKETVDEMLPFAALATVCDVMELKDENRIIVREGLLKMGQTENPGLRALLTVCELAGKTIGTFHAGFVLGPCINATGRLDSAKRALSLFTSDNYEEAVVIARELRDLNVSRKKMTEDGAQKAVEMIETTDIKNDRVIVIYLEDTHESLAGIIAGRIKERYHRPCFVVTKCEGGLKGSGRSIPAYDMYEALSAVKDLFTRFGGHKMAAGISLENMDKLDELRRRLNDNCTLTDEDMTEKILIDVPMPLSYIREDLITSLEILEPFGTGNPKPVFATSKISLISYTRLGKNKNVGKFRIKDETGKDYEMIHFGDPDLFEDFLKGKFGVDTVGSLEKGNVKPGDMMIDIVYYPDINEYGNRRSIQIVMDHYR